MLSLWQLYTDNTNDDANNDDDDTNDTWWTNHDCIGSLACMTNEPKNHNFSKKVFFDIIIDLKGYFV